MKLMAPNPDGRRKLWASDRYGSSPRLPVSWNTFLDPVGTSNVSPAAATVREQSLRQKVHFGPRCSSAKPVSRLTPPSGFLGLSDTNPSSLITNDQRSVKATRAWVPKNSLWPPRKIGLRSDAFW